MKRGRQRWHRYFVLFKTLTRHLSWFTWRPLSACWLVFASGRSVSQGTGPVRVYFGAFRSDPVLSSLSFDFFLIVEFWIYFCFCFAARPRVLWIWYMIGSLVLSSSDWPFGSDISPINRRILNQTARAADLSDSSSWWSRGSFSWRLYWRFPTDFKVI